MFGIFWILIGVILLGFYNAQLLLDDKTPEDDPKNKNIEDSWHFIGACIFIYLAITAWYIWGIEYVPFVLSSFWVIFAAIVHKIALNKPPFFVGTTAKTDKLIRRFFPKNPEKGSMIVKVMALILSVLAVIFL
jgi:hypothetical protein